jgi:hypothetical protein
MEESRFTVSWTSQSGRISHHSLPLPHAHALLPDQRGHRMLRVSAVCRNAVFEITVTTRPVVSCTRYATTLSVQIVRYRCLLQTSRTEALLESKYPLLPPPFPTGNRTDEGG